MRKLISIVLTALIVISLPTSVLAQGNDFVLGSTDCDFYNLIEKKDYTLAPGAVESEIIINDDSGSNRNVVHVIEIDPNNDNIYAMPSFKNISADVDYTNKDNWGTMIMSEQSKYVENTLGLNVVGAMNVCLSWDFDHPYGLLVYEGKVLCDNRASCDTCGVGHPGGGYLVIYKDGKAELRNAMEELTGDEWMAQTVCFDFLVKNGVNINKAEDHKDANRAPRSVIGVKADGSLVIMMNDGRMAPYSAGFTNHEMAEMMLALGCVDAINCDGGGSSTFITEREGSGELTVKSRFSDGAERETLTGIMIISKAVADGKFDHAVLDKTEQYITPGSTAEFSIAGADSAGGPADIPDDIEWKLADETMGTVQDGVFVSSGKVGTAVVQVVYNGEVVGEDTIDVVIPEKIFFTKENYTVPFNKTINIAVKATINDGLNEITLKPADYTISVSNAALGVVDGNVFTAADENATVTNGTLELVFNGTDLTDSANLTLGKGSVVMETFEGAVDINDYAVTPQYNVGEVGYAEIVTAETGKVRNGEHALAVTLDGNYYTYYTGRVGWKMTEIRNMIPETEDLTKATAFGFWMYVPQDCISMWARVLTTNSANANININFLNVGQSFPMERDGWYYFSVPLDKTKDIRGLQFYIEDYVDGAEYGYIAEKNKNQLTSNTFYFDDFTLDYSDAVEDRDVPTFEQVYVSYGSIEPTAMKGQTIDEDTVTITVQAKDVVKDNTVGLDTSSATAFLDGVEIKENVSCTSNGLVTIANIKLAEGYHTFRIEIADANGNTAHVTRSICVDTSEKDAPIIIEATDKTVEFMPSGSLYYVDVKATDIAKFDSATFEIDLNGAHNWELDYMNVAYGYDVSYSVNKFDNNATITITKTQKAEAATGTFTLVTLPIRIWTVDPEDTDNKNAQWTRQVVLHTDYGVVTYTDGTNEKFAMTPMVVDTEHYFSANFVTAEFVETTDRWHEHIAQSVEDKDATCTENGYTGRTVCVGCACDFNTETNACIHNDGCGSIVDWGTVIAAKGHAYTLQDDMLKCANCGKVNTFTGVYKDGDVYRYFINGNVETGWVLVDGDWYYFRYTTKAAQPGYYTVGGVKYHFEQDGKLTTGIWEETENGWRYHYGPGWYGRGWADIDGNRYYFDSNGYRAEGIFCLRVLYANNPVWYEFDENGVFIGQLTHTGFYEFEGKTYYLINGVGQLGIQLIDGEYYYFHTTDGVMATDEYTHVYETNDLLPEGNYYFDAAGKMAEAKNGIVEEDGALYYYINGKLQKGVGMIEIDGDYYFVRSNGKLATGYYNTYNNNGLKPDGTYYFDLVTGKLTDVELKNGIVTEDDGLYYYVNGVLQEGAGMIEVDGDYYFVRSNGKLAVGSYNTYNNNGLKPDGVYYFDPATGKLTEVELKNGIVEEDGALYYYVNGLLQKGAGMIQIDGDYYFVRSNGKLAVGTYETYNNNGLLADGVYEFDRETGKLILYRDGIVFENGDLYYYVDDVLQKGAGMIEIDGDYYFVRSNGKLAVGLYNTYNNNGLKPNGEYFFDYVTGKMDAPKDGIVAEAGALYYYVNGVRQQNVGLIEIDGDYYFVRSNGKLATGLYNTYKNNGLLPEGEYNFDVNTGKLMK